MTKVVKLADYIITYTKTCECCESIFSYIIYDTRDELYVNDEGLIRKRRVMLCPVCHEKNVHHPEEVCI